MQLDDCLFCRIARGEIPAAKVYEDDEVLAFKDIHPKAPVHFLIIPKKHIQSLAHAEPEDNALLGKMLGLTRKLAMQEGAVNGSASSSTLAVTAVRKSITYTFMFWAVLSLGRNKE